MIVEHSFKFNKLISINDIYCKSCDKILCVNFLYKQFIWSANFFYGWYPKADNNCKKKKLDSHKVINNGVVKTVIWQIVNGQTKIKAVLLD